MKVKICGVKNVSAVKAAVDGGADFIGLMFAESKRNISVEQARKLACYIPPHIKKVGVFVNPRLNQVLEVINKVGINFTQLHGDESPEFCREIPIPVIKAFQLNEKEDVEKARKYNTAYYLFDSPGGKYRGGSGMTFNWQWLKDMNIPQEKVILAGGLQAENIQAAIQEVKPAIVDVSSGVETDGEKDPKKIQVFIKKAKKEE
ncbi:phosphoribosylanthranilate isomerase [Salinibacillus kushneri]|uniref:N-(5'-phosphoribosyl)anthranilate isomerase n=1 Tax=Salinibacillus kushneri TaxID=237682 RepID=A0A1I0GLE5_9BACI|nr:phosphoribosylanthranilate isomerase [Salinibacillus kushneri]SET70891.1 phosphoribosylanthranilate isomerase [Salinibacillus kushneri]